jgi:hypothetical protein
MHVCWIQNEDDDVKVLNVYSDLNQQLKRKKNSNVRGKFATKFSFWQNWFYNKNESPNEKLKLFVNLIKNWIETLHNVIWSNNTLLVITRF